MLKIDNSLLEEVGLGPLPDAEKNSFLKHVYETLEMRVGIRLADQMSNQQLDEFEKYFEAKDDAGAFKWLETNFPNYKEIVQEEFDKLKGEITQQAPQILAGSQAAQAQAPVAQGQVVPAPAPQPTYQPPQPTQPLQPPVPAQPQAPPPPLPMPAQPPAPYAPPQPPTPQPPQPFVDPTPPPPPAPPMPPQPDFPAQQPPAGPQQ